MKKIVFLPLLFMFELTFAHIDISLEYQFNSEVLGVNINLAAINTPIDTDLGNIYSNVSYNGDSMEFAISTLITSSSGSITSYSPTKFNYHTTYANPIVFNTSLMSINTSEALIYSIINKPIDYNSLINVVFVVKLK